eukprot:1156904-Pelagomonas_calceolata.AAC.2
MAAVFTLDPHHPSCCCGSLPSFVPALFLTATHRMTHTHTNTDTDVHTLAHTRTPKDQASSEAS